jgi:LEA14-like dessication related protein
MSTLKTLGIGAIVIFALTRLSRQISNLQFDLQGISAINWQSIFSTNFKVNFFVTNPLQAFVTIKKITGVLYSNGIAIGTVSMDQPTQLGSVETYLAVPAKLNNTAAINAIASQLLQAGIATITLKFVGEAQTSLGIVRLDQTKKINIT